MPKISDERKDERREQILDGRASLLRRARLRGRDGRAARGEIGLSRGAIFNYFPSKEDLFVELARRDNARMSEVWLEQGWRRSCARSSRSIPAWLVASTWR